MMVLTDIASGGKVEPSSDEPLELFGRDYVIYDVEIGRYKELLDKLNEHLLD